MNLFLLLVRSSWRIVLLSGLVGAVGGLASVGLIAVIYRVLLDPAAGRETLIVAYLAFCILVLGMQVASQFLLTRLAQNSISQLRMGLCRRILASPLARLEEIGEHRMLASLTGDVGMISLAMNGVPVLCVNAMILIFGAAFLGWLSLPLLVGAVGFLAAGVASYWYSAKFANRYVRRGREAQDEMLKHIRAMIGGIKELKIHRPRRQEFVNRLLSVADRDVRENQYLGNSMQGAAISWGRLMFLVAIGLLLFVWPDLFATDADALAGYALTILYLMTPVEKMVAWLPLLARATVAIDHIQRLGLMLDAADDRHAAPAAGSPAARPQIAGPQSAEYPAAGCQPAASRMPAVEDPETYRWSVGGEVLRASGQESSLTSEGVLDGGWQLLELAGVTHRYQREGEERGFVLAGIDLHLQPGEIVFVIGGNGSGKTTLLKLLTGLYLPEEGEIRLDGQPILAESLESYRQMFTAVFDDAAVFDRLLGLDTIDLDQRAAQYLRELQLDRVLSIRDGVFSTTKLSRGQRKRLALLTAYLEDRPIYVFDEWAADQDPQFKRVFYRKLLPELRERGKAVLAITHDDRYFPCADRVIKLEDGRLAASAGLADGGELWAAEHGSEQARV